jgi:hypothetical protein
MLTLILLYPSGIYYGSITCTGILLDKPLFITTTIVSPNTFGQSLTISQTLSLGLNDVREKKMKNDQQLHKIQLVFHGCQKLHWFTWAWALKLGRIIYCNRQWSP